MRRLMILFASLIFFSAYSALSDTLRKITVLATSDIHSQVDTDSKPGMLRLAAALETERKNAGGSEHCLLIDCGDTIQGSRQASLSNGELGVRFLKELKYDAWIPGNHEYDFGKDRFLEIVRTIGLPVIAANLLFDGKRETLPWKIFVKDGVRIAVIGMTAPNLGKWHWGNKAKGLSSGWISEALDEVIPAVMAEKSDMIVLAVHQGSFQGDRNEPNIARIAATYPQIDLILGAHTHQEVPGEIVGISSWYVQAGCYGSSYAKIVAEVDIGKHKTVRLESKIASVLDFPADQFKFSDEFRDIVDSAAKTSARLITTFDSEISPEEAGRLTANAIFKSAPDISSAVLILPNNGIRQGRFTEDDLFRAFPFEDTICTIELNDDEVKTIMDEASKLKDVKAVLFRNDKYAENPGRRKVAATNFSVAGAGNRLKNLADFAKKTDCRATDTGINLRDAFRKYASARGTLY